MIGAKPLVTLMFFLSLGACATKPPPIKEYNLARTAIESATTAQAPQHAPAYWSRAERAFHRAEEQYRSEKFEEASASFRDAKMFAERAENAAALKVMKEGGSR